MIKLKHLILALLAIVIAYPPGVAHAFSIPPSMPLPQTIAQAELIVAARVVKYLPDAETEKPQAVQKALDTGFIMGPEALLYSSRLKSPGLYSFRTVRTLKGQSQPELQAHLPAVISIYYYYGESKVNAEPGSLVLLLLKRDAQEQWKPVDSTLPLIPLGTQGLASKSEQKNSGIETRVVHLLLASLADADVRRANTYLLRSVVHPDLVEGLLPYASDPDFGVRDSLLYSLATQQYVESIPQIALLEEVGRQEGTGTSAVSALAKFKTPEAIPYLNPLLFQSSKYTRINAMFALSRLADRSSIPYFILALRDPNEMVAYSAYLSLYRLLPSLGVPGTRRLFETNRAGAIAPLLSWWADELAGIHDAEEEGRGN